MTYVSDHTPDCDWHVDQYDFECTCGAVERKKGSKPAVANPNILPPGAWEGIMRANPGIPSVVETPNRKWRVVEEKEWRTALAERLKLLHGQYAAVTGPGRSGAVAAVYASHFLHVPYIPPTAENFDRINGTVLVIDTAIWTGKTIRKLAKKIERQNCAVDIIAIFDEKKDGLVKFWYEVWP